jgi:hypothetical protein
MMKLGKIIDVASQGLKTKISNMSIGLEGLNFSRWIATRYGILHRSDSMPTLIFRKFSDIKANNSSHCAQGNSYLSFLNFNYFINTPLQKTLSFLSNYVTSIRDIRTDTKIQTSIRFCNQVSLSPNIHQHLYAEIIEKVNAKLFFKNRYIQSTKHEKVIYELIKEVDKQFVHVSNQPSLHKRYILTLANQEMSNYRQRNNIEAFILKTDKKTHFAGPVEKPSKRYYVATNTIGKPLQCQTRTLKDEGSIESEHIGEWKRQLMPEFLNQPSLYTRDIQTLVFPLTSSYSQETFNFKHAGLKPGSVVETPKMMHIVSKIINAIYKGINISFFKKTEVNTWYKNNVQQIEEIKNQCTHVLHQLPLSKMELMHVGCKIKQRQVFKRYYNSGNVQFPASIFLVQLHNSDKKNIPTLEIKTVLGYLQNMSNFDSSPNINAVSQVMNTSISSVKPVVPDYRHKIGTEISTSNSYEIFYAAKKVEIPSARTITFQSTEAPLLQRTRNFKDNENISSEQLRREKEQYIQKLHQVSISSKRVLTFVKSMICSYLHRDNTETFISKTGSKISDVRPGTNPSKRNYEAAWAIKIPMPLQTGALKKHEDIESENMREEKKQFMPDFLRQPFLETRNFLTSLNPLTINYLQKAFNFEFLSLFNYDTSPSIIRPGRTVVSAKKVSRESKVTSTFTQKEEALSYQQINVHDMQYENVLKSNAESGRIYPFPSFNDVKVLKDSSYSSHNSFSQAPPINLKHFDYVNKKTEYPDVNADFSYNSEELVFRKLTSRKKEIFTENKGNIQTKKFSPNETHENPGKEIIKEKKIHEHEIGIIADKVYRIIEKRILIEKDRRGLF